MKLVIEYDDGVFVTLEDKKTFKRNKRNRLHMEERNIDSLDHNCTMGEGEFIAVDVSESVVNTIKAARRAWTKAVKK